jgi:hypothetical protein
MVELLTLLKGMTFLTRFILRGERKSMIELERQAKYLASVVDRFYELLGPRNWVFHEDLEPTRIDALLGFPVEDAERALIDQYKERETLRFWVGRLARFPELQVRMALIERAEADFREGRYYATVQTLISVMDGFVNDVVSDERRGLHARDEDDMTAWDSVVGHHMGLTHAHKTFTKTFRKTSIEDVRELYRNGIVHGMLVNYDNDVVGAKAWNRLFAVADWATSREKQRAVPKQRPSWRELLRSIDRNRRVRESLDLWRPSSALAGDDDFETDPVVVASRAYLEAWRAKNYGRMAALLSPLLTEDTPGKTAGMVREEFDETRLGSFDLQRVDHKAAAVAQVDISLTIDGERRLGRMRWIRTGPDDRAVAPNQDGTWRLMTWSATAMANERRDDAFDAAAQGA